MSTFKLFSKRQKELRGDIPDTYTYDKIPQPLRVQIVHIWQDTLGDESAYHTPHVETRSAYTAIVKLLCREYGFFILPGSKEYGGRNYLSELANFLLKEENAERVLDAVEISFNVIGRVTRKQDYMNRRNAAELAASAIEELNLRFREHGVGYQYTDEGIIRVDSEFLHAETVKPALVVLRSPEYAGAQAEFLKAHEHYRHGHMKEALTECLKSLESVMKAICAKRRWQHAANATNQTLLQVLFDKGLIPSFWIQHFSALRATLESGVPSARNKLGGHGQGTEIVQVPEYLVAYVLHLTASSIVFLAEAERNLP